MCCGLVARKEQAVAPARAATYNTKNSWVDARSWAGLAHWSVREKRRDNTCLFSSEWTWSDYLHVQSNIKGWRQLQAVASEPICYWGLVTNEAYIDMDILRLS